MASTKERERDWADDDEEIDDVAGEIPPPQTIQNKDGTKTALSYYLNDKGQTVKTTRRVRFVTQTKTFNPRVVAREKWSKFGGSEGDGEGPSKHTTSVGENIILRLSLNWLKGQNDEKLDPDANLKEQLKDKTVHCRICNGEHFTARCPYKDTMAPIGDGIAGDAAGGMDDESAGASQGGGGAGAGKKGSYVPPAMRAGGDRAGNSPGSKYGERDDYATLRVTNVSEMAEEQELRDMFERFGRVTRVFLAKDHATGLAKGFAFISFADRSDAAKACAKMDGFGFKHLILKVEFAKKPQQ